MKLNIPKSHKEILVKYSEIPSEKRKELLAFLNREEIFETNLDDLPALLNEHFQSIDIDFERLVEVLYSINRSLLVYKKERATFVDEILAALSREDINLRDDIRSDLFDLLNSTFATASKAIGLFLENDKIFSSARILTDLRPIFTEEKEPKIIATIISHTLKIVYKDSESDDKEVFIVLQPSELKLLKDQIIRAEVKESEIKNSLSSTVKIIDLKL